MSENSGFHQLISATYRAGSLFITEDCSIRSLEGANKLIRNCSSSLIQFSRFFLFNRTPFCSAPKKWFNNYETHFGMVGHMLETANCMGSLVHIGTICLGHGISHAMSMRAPDLAIRQGSATRCPWWFMGVGVNSRPPQIWSFGPLQHQINFESSTFPCKTTPCPSPFCWVW